MLLRLDRAGLWVLLRSGQQPPGEALCFGLALPPSSGIADKCTRKGYVTVGYFFLSFVLFIQLTL